MPVRLPDVIVKCACVFSHVVQQSRQLAQGRKPHSGKRMRGKLRHMLRMLFYCLLFFRFRSDAGDHKALLIG